MRRCRPLRALACLSILAGCTVGPDYHPPAIGTPAAFSDGGVGAAAATDLRGWWSRFNDPLLGQLVDQAMAGNLDVQQAASRVAQARQAEVAALAQGWPSLNASTQGSYTRLSRNLTLGNLLGSSLGGGSGAPNLSQLGQPGTGFALYQLGFDAAWEVDLFGGVRRSVEAAAARTGQMEWNVRDAQLLLAAEVARNYVQFRATQHRLALADATLRDERTYRGLVAARTSNGLSGTLDLRRQDRQIAEAAADRETLLAERDIRLHALGTLLGQAPLALRAELEAVAPIPVPAAVPPGLPSDLLRRRPDIRAAERKLAARTAGIGVAVADLYPRFSLTGAISLVSPQLSTLFTGGSLQPTGSGRLSLPLFDRGRRRAAVSQREAEAEEALLAYRATVLAALRDVEDALSRLDTGRRRTEELRAAEAAARDALGTARVQYRNGLTALLDVLEAQNALRTLSDALVQARAAEAEDVVALCKALGGGWDGRPGTKEQ